MIPTVQMTQRVVCPEPRDWCCSATGSLAAEGVLVSDTWLLLAVGRRGPGEDSRRGRRVTDHLDHVQGDLAGISDEMIQVMVEEG